MEDLTNLEFDDEFADLELDLEQEAVKDDGEITFDVYDATYNIAKTDRVIQCYITDDVQVAKHFNPDLDEFTSYEFFLLPEGYEIKNENLLGQLEAKDDLQSVTESKIKESLIMNFDNLYFRSMLTQVH